VVLATIGEKSINGVVANPRLVVRKVRGGIAGRGYAFATSIVDTKVLDNKLRPITTLVIKWSEQTAQTGAKDKEGGGWSKSTKLLRQTLMNVLVGHGSEQRPFPDGPMVRAVDMEIVRAEFYKTYVTKGETAKAKQDAKQKAFIRALKSAQEASVIGVREINDITFIWLAKAGRRPSENPPSEENPCGQEDGL
jgi:hypothetical protein